ncbi:MAG: hypothetical protein A3H36_02690 [Chloroflexi bacterium RIFCSPLOWO2_02_FULL_71_16]|nr:MAG: hypothetical protein A2082_00610 [Chloroflexi bacterium GWC2_70_10]OGO69739.1 MAG: hypothetical protein A3H36_02690 [Chloroflexi bacterium RIFCSPLOWO2_02_FULL_71_16]
MSRITVRIDPELIARVMLKYGFRTKREAIDFALRQAAGYDASEILALRGTGWEGDLRKMRRTRNLEI